jgi:uncharacterized membrane protein YphA (DoxX/SURF4 family)
VTLFTALTVLSGVAFVVYGISCVFSQSMAREFTRFGLAPFRVLVGALEVLGGTGLLLGLFWSLPLLAAAAAGLTLLMALGVGVRIRLRDGVLLTLPALVLFIVNGYLAIHAWEQLIA